MNLEQNWSMDLEELERAYSNAEAKPAAICIINPGNPTGQVLSKGMKFLTFLLVNFQA